MYQDLIFDSINIFDIYGGIYEGNFVAVMVSDVELTDNIVYCYELKVIKMNRTDFRLSYDNSKREFRSAPAKLRRIAPKDKPNCHTKPPLLAVPEKNNKGEMSIQVEVDGRFVKLDRLYETGDVKKYYKLMRTTFRVHSKDDLTFDNNCDIIYEA